MYRASLLTLAALAIFSTGCERTPVEADTTVDPPRNGIVAGTLEVTAKRPNLTLRNTSEFIIGYVIVDSEMATIALFPPCGNSCPTLVQSASIVVPYSAIGGYSAASQKANVLWFKYRRSADGTLEPIGGVNVAQVTL
ncbi:MAG: hypothetical protein ACOVSI_10885 [Gemmatimonas sp.]|jgi:hypothetical protein